MVLTRRGFLFVMVAALVTCSAPKGPAWGEAADPAALTIQVFYDTLLDSMRHAGEIKMQGRYDRLYPVMTKIFDVPNMTRMAIGPEFDQLTPSEQNSLRDAFGKLLVATFASTFDDYKGETFTVDGDVSMRGADKFVRSKFHPNGAPVDLNYLMRGKDSVWRIVDIYLNGTISQLATWRTEYGASFSTGGFAAVMAAVQTQTSKYMSAF